MLGGDVPTNISGSLPLQHQTQALRVCPSDCQSGQVSSRMRSNPPQSCWPGCPDLINAVLDGMPTYAMGALVLPVGVKEALDAKR